MWFDFEAISRSAYFPAPFSCARSRAWTRWATRLRLQLDQDPSRHFKVVQMVSPPIPQLRFVIFVEK
jgi:hypothetical protein